MFYIINSIDITKQITTI
uniref:Uncharacterized protein n=1 Tax=Rhizophora mucronata TaxID=61149 RepID=A0A2P2NY41_RHIMU